MTVRLYTPPPLHHNPYTSSLSISIECIYKHITLLPRLLGVCVYTWIIVHIHYTHVCTHSMYISFHSEYGLSACLHTSCCPFLDHWYDGRQQLTIKFSFLFHMSKWALASYICALTLRFSVCYFIYISLACLFVCLSVCLPVCAWMCFGTF